MGFEKTWRARSDGRRSAHRLSVGIAVLALTLVGCDSGTEPPDDVPPEPGTVTYQLLSTHAAEGGFLFSVPVTGIVAISGASAAASLVVHETDGLLFVAVVHRFGAAGLQVSLDVNDIHDPPQPTLLSVVGPDNLQRPREGYSLVPVS